MISLDGFLRRVLKLAKKLDMMIIRTDIMGNMVYAKPCYCCTLMLKNIGINKVYYSDYNNFTSEKVSQMISINQSYTSRRFDNKLNDINCYKKMFENMPKYIKKINVCRFLQTIQDEIICSNYKLTNNIIYININAINIATINII